MDPDSPVIAIVLIISLVLFLQLSVLDGYLARLPRSSYSDEFRGPMSSLLIDGFLRSTLKVVLVTVIVMLGAISIPYWMGWSHFDGSDVSGLMIIACSLFLILLVTGATCSAFANRFWMGARVSVALLCPVLMLLKPISKLERLVTGSDSAGMVLESSDAGFGKSITDTQGLSLDANSNNDEEVLAPHERKMISSILKLDETTVHEVMVPRADIVAVDNSTPLLKVAEFMSETGHSRIPIYDHNIDNIVGVVHSKDLLKYLSDSSSIVEIADIARPPLFIPDAKRLDELLRDFQEMHVHMAVVVDEYGGTSGLVTIEDLLEEIVGEIEDEFDIPESMIEMIEDDAFLMDARVSLEELNHVFDLELEGEGFDTLGGLLYQQMGKIPAPGEEITVGQLTIKVISTLGRRIKKVQVRRLTLG